MNKYLFAYNIRQNALLFLIILSVLLLYFSIIIPMYDPAGNEDLIAMASMKMSPEMLKAFGFTITPNVSLTPFLASYLYGMLMIIIPMIYTSICANRLVAQHTDKGSMAFLLSAPISRKRIVTTQALFLLLSTFMLLLCITLFAVIYSNIKFPGLLDVRAFIALNWALFALMSFISGIAFMASVCADTTQNSLAFGLGVPLFFYVVKMAADATDYAFLKYMTFYSLFDYSAIAATEASFVQVFILLFAALLLYCTSISCFSQKQLAV